LTLDVEEVLSEHSGALINWDTGTVELTTQHFCGDRHAEHITSELDVSLQVIDIRSTFENLNNSTSVVNLEDLTLSQGAIAKTDVHNLGVFGELDIVENDKGAVNVFDGTVIDTGSDVVVAGGGGSVDLSN